MATQIAGLRTTDGGTVGAEAVAAAAAVAEAAAAAGASAAWSATSAVTTTTTSRRRRATTAGRSPSHARMTAATRAGPPMTSAARALAGTR